jgi:hypothetical protein
MKPYRLIFITVISLMGAISFINNSGYALNIGSGDKTAYTLLAVSSVIAIVSMTRSTKINKKDILFCAATVIIYFVRPYFAGYGIDGFRFITYFLSIYIVSKLCFDEINLNFLCICYGLLTGVILFVCNFGSILKGWNPNSLAIQAFQMLAIFCIGYNTDFKRIKLNGGVWIARLRILIFWGLIIYATILMETLECRSASISCIVTAILMIKNNFFAKLLKNKKVLLVLILAPCIIAFFVVYISDWSQIEQLNEWSIRQFQKTIFNGRDRIWESGLRIFYANLIYGTGNLNYGNWHNSAIACLTTFGIVGYFIYVKVFYNALSKASFYMNDVFVRKATIVFLIVNFQQAFENTICQSKLMILHPFMILGIILGRIAYLKYENRSKYNSTGIQYRKLSS